MLTQVEEGKIHLEDEDAHIELDFSNAVSFSWSGNTFISLIFSVANRNMNTDYLQTVLLY
jgi:hypothetical protein